MNLLCFPKVVPIMTPKQLANDKRVKNFVDIARRYCTFMESVGTTKKRDFIHGCAALIPELYLHIIPILNMPYHDEMFETNKESLSPHNGRKIYNDISRKLSKDNRYHELYDPYDNEETVGTCLADDLAGIYCDIKRGLNSFDCDGQGIFDAVFCWKLHHFHWGNHCCSAMRPLHELIVRYHEKD